MSLIWYTHNTQYIHHRQAEAAEARSKDFKQGGGGDKLKAKAKALEEAEKKQRELGGPAALKWTV